MSFRRLLAPLLAVIALSAPTALASTVVSQTVAPGGVAGKTSVISIDSGGLTRSYRLFVPNVLPAGPRPLVVALHGHSVTGEAMESATGLDKSAAKAGVLVAYPDGYHASWNAGTCCYDAKAANVDDIGFLSSLITDVASRYSVDKLRVAVAGFSNGGMMAYAFGCARTDLVDVIVVMSGAYMGTSCTLSRPLSVLHMHGLLDTTVPYLGGTVTPLKIKVRPTLGPIGAIGVQAGCTSLPTVPFPSSPLVTETQAAGCRPGTQLIVLASSTLGHLWPTGTTSVPQYGFDATTMTWGFLVNTWATRGTPVAL